MKRLFAALILGLVISSASMAFTDEIEVEMEQSFTIVLEETISGLYVEMLLL